MLCSSGQRELWSLQLGAVKKQISVRLLMPNAWILSLHYLGNCKFGFPLAKRPLNRRMKNALGGDGRNTKVCNHICAVPAPSVPAELEMSDSVRGRAQAS